PEQIGQIKNLQNAYKDAQQDPTLSIVAMTVEEVSIPDEFQFENNDPGTKKPKSTLQEFDRHLQVDDFNRGKLRNCTFQNDLSNELTSAVELTVNYLNERREEGWILKGKPWAPQAQFTHWLISFCIILSMANTDNLSTLEDIKKGL